MKKLILILLIALFPLIGLSQVGNPAKFRRGIQITNMQEGQATDSIVTIDTDGNLTYRPASALGSGGGIGIVADGFENAANLPSNSVITVTHGLGYVPDISRISLENHSPNASSMFTRETSIVNVTATTFGIALSGNTIAFPYEIHWKIFGTDSATPLSGSELVSAIDTELGQTDWKTSGSSSSGLGGSIADNQVAFGNGTDISGSNDLYFDDESLGLIGSSANRYLRFSETNGQYNGSFLQYEGTTNKFHMGVHFAGDNDPLNDTKVFTMQRSDGFIGINNESPSFEFDMLGTFRNEGVRISPTFTDFTGRVALINPSFGSSRLGDSDLQTPSLDIGNTINFKSSGQVSQWSMFSNPTGTQLSIRSTDDSVGVLGVTANPVDPSGSEPIETTLGLVNDYTDGSNTVFDVFNQDYPSAGSVVANKMGFVMINNNTAAKDFGWYRYDGTTYTPIMEILGTGTGDQAEFFQPVKGVDAVNGDEFVTKSQMEAAGLTNPMTDDFDMGGFTIDNALELNTGSVQANYYQFNVGAPVPSNLLEGQFVWDNDIKTIVVNDGEQNREVLLRPENETNLQRKERLINSVLENKFEYPTPDQIVVVNNLAELQAQENADNGTEIQLAAGLVIDLSTVTVRLDFNNEVYLTSQDKNNQGTILLGEMTSHIKFNGDNSMAYDFIYRGTWVHTHRPDDPVLGTPGAPDTVGIVVDCDNFKAYNLTGSGFSYAAVDLKDAENAHIEECTFFDVQATGLGYGIVLNGESTLTSYKNYYYNYRHCIAKASDSPLQGYTEYKSYAGKHGNTTAPAAWDSHGEPDGSGVTGSTSRWAGGYMNIIDCYSEENDYIAITLRGVPRVESVIAGNTFVNSSRATAFRQVIREGLSNPIEIFEPNNEENVYWFDNLIVGQQEDPDLALNDKILVVDDEGLFDLDLFSKERNKVTSNFRADFAFTGDFITIEEYLTINNTSIQIFKEGLGMKHFTLSEKPKGVIRSKVFQTAKQELIFYTDTDIIGVNFSTGSIVETVLFTGLDIKFVLAGNFRNSNPEKDLIVVSNTNVHDIYENTGTAFNSAISLGTHVNFTSGHVMDLFNNGTDDVIYYDLVSHQGFRARFLSGTYRETPALSFTRIDDNETFFVKNINGIDQLFVWGLGGQLRAYKAGLGFQSLSIVEIAYLGKASVVSNQQ